MRTVIDELTSTPEGMRAYQRARTELEVTELIAALMEDRGIDQGGLADLLGVSKRAVKRMMADGQHMTLKKLSDVLLVLGHSVRVEAVPLTLSYNPPEVP